MTVKVTQSVTQDITFQDTKANLHSIPGYCGARVYTFAGVMPSYLSLDASQTILTLSTNNIADVGTHSITFTVSLANFTSVPGITKTFQVIVICEAFTLVFTTSPTNIFIEPGVTVQPLTKAFAISQTPNCGNP
jgi:hypothetical protein